MKGFLLAAALAAGSTFGLWQPAAAAGPFTDWILNGVGLSAEGAVLTHDGRPTGCDSKDVDGLDAAYDPVSGQCRASDAASEYNGADFSFGSLTSPVMLLDQPASQLLGSWDAVTPAGTWIQLHMRMLQNAGWSDWYALPVWASDTSTLERHSGTGRKDASIQADMDSLISAPGLPASAYQMEVTLFSAAGASPTLRLVHIATSPGPTANASNRAAWGTELPVPQRSQMLPAYGGLGFGGGGEAWCSPTSTSMVMAYWGNMLHLPELVQTVPTVAAGTYDYVYGGTGNWSFNTAYAGRYGLTAYVEHMSSLAQVEPWVKASVPVVISIAFHPGQLLGAPIPSSPGHLIVVRGFTPAGDVIVNDPAAPTDAATRLTYPRQQLESVWQGHGGTAYILYPPGWAVPDQTSSPQP